MVNPTSDNVSGGVRRQDLSKMTVGPKRLVRGGGVDQVRDWRRTAGSRSGGR